MRRAPKRIDYDIGSLVVGDDYNLFPIIVDGTAVQCGEYQKMKGTVPDIPT